MASGDGGARRGATDEGAAAVEFALVSLLLVTLLLGIVAFGIGLFRQQSALHAAREGARLAAVGVNDCAAFRTAVASRGTGAGITASNVTLAIVDDSANGAAGVNKQAVVTVKFTVDLSYLGFLGFTVMHGEEVGRSRVERLGSVTTSC